MPVYSMGSVATNGAFSRHVLGFSGHEGWSGKLEGASGGMQWRFNDTGNPPRKLSYGIRRNRLVGHQAQCSLAKKESWKTILLSSGRL
eukprot:scaffold132660_cov26-Tisochrysis_lutea.AAC.1